MTRLMACPHCGHTCKSDGIGAVYCGPHGTYHPAVRMEQIEPEGHAEDHLDAACLDGTCSCRPGECIAADREALNIAFTCGEEAARRRKSR